MKSSEYHGKREYEYSARIIRLKSDIRNCLRMPWIYFLGEVLSYLVDTNEINRNSSEWNSDRERLTPSLTAPHEMLSLLHRRRGTKGHTHLSEFAVGCIILAFRFGWLSRTSRGCAPVAGSGDLWLRILEHRKCGHKLCWLIARSLHKIWSRLSGTAQVTWFLPKCLLWTTSG